MTDRYNALTVVLEKNLRDDDAESLIAAIKMIKGVGDVQPHVADHNSMVAKYRARQEFGEKLWAVLYPQQRRSGD